MTHAFLASDFKKSHLTFLSKRLDMLFSLYACNPNALNLKCITWQSPRKEDNPEPKRSFLQNSLRHRKKPVFRKAAKERKDPVSAASDRLETNTSATRQLGLGGKKASSVRQCLIL
jgi:hypothetical protein